VKDTYAQHVEIPGSVAFYLYESFGFPMELTEEVLGKKVNTREWEDEYKKHQEKSRAGAEQKFAGGLADHSEIVVRMHTATHLLHKALRNVLGDHVEQKGSNITAERLRFDFNHGAKMTPEQIAAVEDMVNQQIAKDLPVHFDMLTVDEAKAAGAIGLFEDKYATLGNKVKVYMVGDTERGYFSKEICGGPHVEHTAMVGKFKILKEEASSAGVRRIKAVVA
jgi:alanyl-tRNA synthetase